MTINNILLIIFAGGKPAFKPIYNFTNKNVFDVEIFFKT